MNLEELKNKTILLFGKPRAFSINEFNSQMKFHNIEVVKELNERVILLVDGRMMTPYEQNISDELYEKETIASLSIETLEKELVQFIDKETLLMSLKLSHDTERLKSFIQNNMINDALFFSLIKMYSWRGEDFFENDNNRDVSAAFIARFYENIERNHNVQYATTGFIHLVAQTKNSLLLSVISELEPLKFHPKINFAIAMSIYCDEAMQKKFSRSEDKKILEALSLNKNLSKTLIEEFMEVDYLGENIAKSIKLDDTLFELLSKKAYSLAQNESLTKEMQEQILSKNEKTFNIALSKNSNISETMIKKLLNLEIDEIKFAIYENSATNQKILSEAYKDELYHESLSKNENTPIEILYQLQLDARYERFVKANAGYGKYIQSENIGWLV